MTGSDVAVVWGGLLAATLVLLVVGWHFTRRTTRIVTVALASLAVVAIAWWGAYDRTDVAFSDAILAGLQKTASAFFEPFFFGASMPPAADTTTWTAFLAILVAGYWMLEAWSARSDPPALEVADAAENSPEFSLVRELRFRLPAVAVRRPALVPGGTTAESLATVVEKTGAPSGAFLASLVSLVGKLWPAPRSYSVKVLFEPLPGGPSGNGAQPNGPQSTLPITVDVRDARTGQSWQVKTLSCTREEMAERVAGFAARTVFRADPTVPRWSVGSFDGEDLAAYLMFQQMSVPVRSPADTAQLRKEQAAVLSRAVHRSPGAGIARYELALLRDMQGSHLDALRLHAVNCAQYPRFHRARYRLAISLEMVAGIGFERCWPAADRELRDELVRNLRRCGLAAAHHDRDLEHAITTDQPRPADLRRIQHALLELAAREFATYRRTLSFWSLLGRCLVYRDERAGWRPYLLPIRSARHHRHQVREGIRVAERLVRVRQAMLDEPWDDPTIHRELAAVNPETGSQGWLPRRYRGQPGDWLHWKRSWSAAYDAACLHAAVFGGLRATSRSDQAFSGEVLARRATELLQRVVDNPDCQMERPYDWISVDPDLAPLHQTALFQDFLSAQRLRDYPAPNYADRPVPTTG